MSDNKYNGWTNYATWRVHLEMWDGYDYEAPIETSDLVEYLKETTDETITKYGEIEGLAVDYARAFLNDVNWYEIAEAILENSEVEYDN